MGVGKFVDKLFWPSSETYQKQSEKKAITLAMAETNELFPTPLPPPIIGIQVVFPEDAVNGHSHIPIKQGGNEISGYIKVVLWPNVDFEVDLAFEGGQLL